MADGDQKATPFEEMAPIRSASVAVAAAKALRDECLRRSADNLFLGSEDELAQRLGVSRPTFRQAARLLEYEELLTVRRGIGGGFFARRPSAEVAASTASLFLLAQGATFADVMRVAIPLESEALRMTAACPDVQLRRPRLFLEARAVSQTGDDVRAGVRAINGFWRLMGELAGNPALALFIHTAQAYGAKASGLNMTAPRQRAYFASLRDICAALEARDPERAVRLNAARTEQMLAWAREDEDYARGERARPKPRKRVATSRG